MRNAKALVFAAALCFCALPSTAYAVPYETEVINSLKVGDISISLNEYELNDAGEEVPYQDGIIILPGQKVDRVVRITNEANTAWIRAKLEYTSEDGIEGLSDAMVKIGDDAWIKRGDYYYYPQPVERDTSIDFIKQIMIPPEWDSSYADKGFKIIVSADAVQTANFTPDFTSDDPWFGTVIELCTHTVHDDQYTVGSDAFSVEFRNGAEGMVKLGDDFFSNWPDLMPGDTVTDTVTIRNNYRRAVAMYFRTETIADDILLDAVTLEIKQGDKVIFSGPLSGSTEGNILLAFLEKGEETVLTYSLHVPAELNNKYAMAQTQTKWIFSCELTGSGGGGNSGGDRTSVKQQDTDPPAPSPSEESTETTDETGETPSIQQQIDKIVKTGESMTPYYALLIMTLSIIGFLIVMTISIVSAWRKKKGAGRR